MKKKVVIAGGTGLIGQKIVEILKKSGDYDIGILTRSPKTDGEVKYYKWDINNKSIDDEALEGTSAIINLTGAGIADSRWTKKRKEIIIKSRTDAAETIKKALMRRNQRLEQYVSTSAIGYYGDSKNIEMVETSSPADNSFMVKCCIAWENAAMELQDLTDHLSILRVGVVLAKNGGALPKMELPFKFGSAGYFGNGEQYYSWIHIDDIARMFVHAMEHNWDGIYNAVAPKPVILKNLIRTMKEVKGGFSVIHPIPAFSIKLLLGEMSAVVLNSNLVSSKKVEKTNFLYTYENLLPALQDLLAE